MHWYKTYVDKDVLHRSVNIGCHGMANRIVFLGVIVF
jgi:hypothetical protein